MPTKLLGDCRQTLQSIPDGYFHTAITSIPYWGLRSYLPKGHPLKHLEIGSEPTFDLYLEHIVDAFRAVKRVMRDDGTLWVNVGDAYASQPGQRKETDKIGNKQATNGGSFSTPSRAPGGYKAKDLMLMPAEVAMALRADGWYLRSMIPWIKRNAMPESVEDRPATATEYVFLFSKGPRYFYDRYAVMMTVSAATNPRLSQKVMDQVGSERARAGGKTNGRMKAVGGKVVLQGEGIKSNASFEGACSMPVSARNRRNTDWWMESFQGLLTDEDGQPLALIVNPKGTSIAHFASYPPKLVEPFVKAGTSERGCCAQCGAPWERQVGPAVECDGKRSGNKERQFRDENGGNADRQTHQGFGFPYEPLSVPTVGWQPTCECHGKLVRGKIIIAARISKENAAAWGADTNGEYLGLSTKNHAAHGVQDASDVKARIIRNATEDREVEGWIYQSELPLADHPVVPCRVLDPFSGTGCTLMVATNLGRDSTGCELNEEYFNESTVRDGQGGLALL